MIRVETSIKTQYGQRRILTFQATAEERPQVVLVHGEVVGRRGVLTRIQSECFTGHVLQSLSCDCHEQWQDSLRLIAAEEAGVLLYLAQEGRGIGLPAKLQSYNLQHEGLDTVDANQHLGFAVDGRSYSMAANIMRELGVASIRLLTNNPTKLDELVEGGIAVDEVIPLPPVIRPENRRYIETKVRRLGHRIDLDR